MKIGDIMTKDVIWMRYDDPVDALERQILQHRINGVPVCNEEGQLVGVVSKTDLIRYLVARRDDPSTDDGSDVFVWQIMTEDVVTVDPDDEIEVVAKMMVEKRIHRVIVQRDDEVVGVTSSFDIMRTVAL